MQKLLENIQSLEKDTLISVDLFVELFDLKTKKAKNEYMKKSLARASALGVKREFLDALEEAKAVSGADFPTPQRLRKATELMKENLPELRAIVGVGEDVPFLVEGTCILSAKSKIGKSWFSLELCDAVSKGKDFMGYKTEQCSTLYLDLETAKPLKKKRLTKLKGIVGNIADTFYIQDSAAVIGDGLEEEIESYFEEDPNIGVIVIDVFEKVLEDKKRETTDYRHYYKNISVLNKIAADHHCAIILVCHSKKTPDPTDPFADILGTTALQGATDQMIVMFKKTYNDSITKIAAKGRTIDGLVEIDGYMADGMWSKADNASAIRRAEEYRNSPYRDGVIRLLDENDGKWSGKCNEFFSSCDLYGIELNLPKDKKGDKDFRPIGKVLSDAAFHELMSQENVEVGFSKNGTGSKIYYFYRCTVDETVTTIDENPW